MGGKFVGYHFTWSTSQSFSVDHMYMQERVKAMARHHAAAAVERDPGQRRTGQVRL